MDTTEILQQERCSKCGNRWLLGNKCMRCEHRKEEQEKQKNKPERELRKERKPRKKENFRFVHIELGKKLGIYKACILSVIEYWQSYNQTKGKIGVCLSLESLEKKMPGRLSKRYLIRLIRELEDKGYIKVQRGKGQRNVYRITDSKTLGMLQRRKSKKVVN